MTPRLSIIASAIRKISQSSTPDYDPYWDNVVLAMRMDTNDSSDPYLANTVLGMHMDGANTSTTFTDIFGKTVTITGSAQISTSQSKFGGSSAYFPSTSDYLSVPDSADFAFGTGDFTIEFWVNLSSTTRQGLISKGADSDWTTFDIVTDGANSRSFEVTISASGGGSAVSISTPAAVYTTGVWCHLALVRSGSLFTLYVDGVSRGSQTYSSGIRTTTAPLKIARSSYYLAGMTGYIDDLRITKGVARYTANFTPPTSAFPSSSSSPFIDEKGHTVTVSGNPVIQSTVKKFGTGAAYFDGVGDYITTAASTDFDLFSGDFTIELFVRLASTANSPRVLNIGTAEANRFTIYAIGSVFKVFVKAGTSTYADIMSSGPISANTWYSVAVTKASGTWRLFIDGAQVASSTSTIVPTGSLQFCCGFQNFYGFAGDYLNGYIDDLRVTKGVARYTAAFTPGTSSFSVGRVDPLYSQVVSLLRFNGDSGASVITDEAGMSWTASSGTITTETDIKRYGTSAGKFINTVKYSTGAVVNIGSNQSYCIECWVYLTSGGEYHGIFDIASTLHVYVQTLNTLVYQVQGGYVISSALDLNRWYHIAIIRTGTSVQFTLDGVVIGTATSTTQYINAVMSLGYNSSITGANLGLRGRMDNFRLTVGSPRYTTTPFVPADCEYLT